MRVKIEAGRCQGHGVCKFEAPEVFDLDGDSGHVVLLQEQPAEDQRAAVQKAVRHCPTFALTLEG